jgi:hypothetical protein
MDVSLGACCLIYDQMRGQGRAVNKRKERCTMDGRCVRMHSVDANTCKAALADSEPTALLSFAPPPHTLAPHSARRLGSFPLPVSRVRCPLSVAVVGWGLKALVKLSSCCCGDCPAASCLPPLCMYHHPSGALKAHARDSEIMPPILPLWSEASIHPSFRPACMCGTADWMTIRGGVWAFHSEALPTCHPPDY